MHTSKPPASCSPLTRHEPLCIAPDLCAHITDVFRSRVASGEVGKEELLKELMAILEYVKNNNPWMMERLTERLKSIREPEVHVLCMQALASGAKIPEETLRVFIRASAWSRAS